MPPKKKEPELKPIVKLYETKAPFWEFKRYSEEETQQIDQFFNTFERELNVNLKQQIKPNLRYLANEINTTQHSFYNERLKTPDQSQVLEFKQEELDSNVKIEEKEEVETENNYLILNNLSIDYLFMKMIFIAIQPSPVITLKFSNNKFSKESLLLLQENLQKNSQIQRLYFDWNNVWDILDSEEIKKFYSSLFNISNLLFISLRNNCLGDLIVEEICKCLIENQNKSLLKYLDLYDNKITNFDQIGEMLYYNSSLECLGLAFNQISSSKQLYKIFYNIGKKSVSNEEYEKYKEIELECQAVLDRNKKKKNKKDPDEPLPFLEVFEEIEGKPFFVRNNKLQMLNLSLNSITDDDITDLSSFLQTTSDNFQLILQQNKLSDKGKTKVKVNFQRKVIV